MSPAGPDKGRVPHKPAMKTHEEYRYESLPRTTEHETFRYAARTAGFRPSAIREILKSTGMPDVISFAGGLPAPELFPLQAMISASEALLADDGPAALQYGVTEGWPPLREWVARHVVESVGLQVRPEDILITSGSQQALDLVAKVLVDPGDVILAENPAYLGALQAFRAYEARIIGLPTDAQGMRIDSLRRVLEEAYPRAPRPPRSYHWQASQVPPLRMASIEHASFSSDV